MTWPIDGEPRFKVSSVTGYSGDGGNNTRSATIYSVLDRACLHAIVFTTPVFHTARRVADELELGDSPWLRAKASQRKSWHRRKAQYGRRP